MASVIHGDFKWDDQKARSNATKHGVSFEEAVTIFLDLDYLLRPDESGKQRFVALGYSVRTRLLLVVHAERGERVRLISARKATRVEREAMSSEERDLEPSSESLEELPEVDFSKAIRPNRYANLRGELEHAVFLDKELWEHFGSEERVLEALRLLVDLASREAMRAG